MAPRKNSKTADSNSQPKTPRSRAKTAKPSLKTPTVIKVKIPLNQSLGSDDATAKLTKKQLTSQKKVELANEVARAQLVKDAPVIEPDITPEAKAVRKGGRKPKIIISAFFGDNNGAADSVKRTPRRRVTRKMSNDSVVVAKKTTVTKKRLADSTQKITKPRTTKVKLENRNKAQINNTISNYSIARNLRNKKNIQGKENLQEQSKAAEDPLSILENAALQNNTETSSKQTAAGPVDSRKTSMTSTSSLSWTKDISSSSATTCVTVSTSDFVRIDKKLPILQLNNVDSEINKTTCNNDDDDSSTSDSDSSDSSTSVNSDLADIIPKPLNLSVSSASPRTNILGHPKNAALIDDLSKALEKLSSKLKNYDLEIINWIGYYDENPGDSIMKKIQENIFKVLKDESDVIRHCQQLNEILSEDSTVKTHAYSDQIDFVKPTNINYRPNSEEFEDNDKFTSDNSRNAMFSQNVRNTPILKVTNDKSDGIDNLVSENVGYMPFDHNCDDDDALSLFAESLSGIESSRYNSSITSVSNEVAAVSEEYVPQPLSRDVCETPKKLVYHPTKISDNTNDVKKAVCEKQNADSTSINRDSEYYDNVSEADLESSEIDDQQTREANNSVKGVIAATVPVVKDKTYPYLMARMFSPLHGIKSIVFRGVCFFNLMNSCKNSVCRFPHTVPDIIEIKNKLTRLREELFIQEYMLIRNWPNLRRAFGMCYVEECQRRDLTRILVEMGIDFILKTNINSREDAAQQLDVLERILLHLNNVDLTICEDLLNFSVAPQTRFCDSLMQTIANTQNFSRFKKVFCNLTDLMVRNESTFRLDVAEHILERVCILPCEEDLYRAVVYIIKNTERDIFQNNMMAQFEKKLATLNQDLHDELLSMNKQTNLSQSVVRSAIAAPAQIATDVEPLTVNTLMHIENEKRYTSPDTTDVDNLKKPTIEPIITRTINLVPFNHTFIKLSPCTKVNGWPEPKKVQNWRHKSLSGAPTPQLTMPVLRTPMRPLKRQRQVTYGVPPVKYPRTPLQDF